MAQNIIINEIKDIALKYISILDNNIKIKDAYLYGSYIRNNYNEDSDIDIAVVSDDFTGDIIDDTLRLMRFRRNVDSRIEPHPFTLDEFNNNPLANEIISTGIKII